MAWPGEIGKPCLIETEAGILHAVFYWPEGEARGRVVLVPPLFEEKRCGHRALVDFARGLARAGWSVLHVDLAGLGNSPGDLTRLTVEDWIGNLQDAANYLDQRSAAPHLSLVGIRAGALLAARAARSLSPPPTRLQLWQPVVDGGKYLAQMRKRRMIQDGLTGHDQNAPVSAGGIVDVDGFAVGEALHTGLQNLRLSEEKLPAETSVQVLQISAGERILPDHVALQKTWGDAVEVRVQVARPFWNPHTPDQYEDIVTAAVGWLGEGGQGDKGTRGGDRAATGRKR